MMSGDDAMPSPQNSIPIPLVNLTTVPSSGMEGLSSPGSFLVFPPQTHLFLAEMILRLEWMYGLERAQLLREPTLTTLNASSDLVPLLQQNTLALVPVLSISQAVQRVLLANKEAGDPAQRRNIFEDLPNHSFNYYLFPDPLQDGPYTLYDSQDPTYHPYILSKSTDPILVSSEIHPAIVIYFYVDVFRSIWFNRKPWRGVIKPTLTSWDFDLNHPGPITFVFGSDRPSQPHPLSDPSQSASSDTSDGDCDRMTNESQGSAPLPEYLGTSEVPVPDLSRSETTVADTELSSSLKRKESPDTPSFHQPDQPYVETWLHHLQSLGSDIDHVVSPGCDDLVLTTYGKENSVDPVELCRFSKRRRIMEPHPLRSSNDWIYIRYKKNAEGESEPRR